MAYVENTLKLKQDCFFKISKNESAFWEGGCASLVCRTGLGRQEISITTESPTLYLNLKGRAECGEYYLNGRQIPFVVRKPGSLVFLPAGYTWEGWDTGDSTASYLSIEYDVSFIKKLDDEFSNALGFRLTPKLGFEHETIQQAARCIAKEVSYKNITSPLMAKSYATAIMLEVFRCGSNKVQFAKGGLSPACLSRILSKIEGEIKSSIFIDELAEEAGLSTSHFIRAFKQSTGYAPYCYISNCRLSYAKSLLKSTSMSITDISLECGYSSSSHFSNTFRQKMGTTPKRYRISCR
ncbi:helix-turn-helix domain-containing protein [Halomonas sp. C22]|uniref:helix-turn-helix domain-containing protein n=1 Tax=Halomonas sp. C22 TaxID=2580567 RepID=UPI00119E165D|nr:AraC family transcriptional regulator [Halomonas sp. C22]